MNYIKCPYCGCEYHPAEIFLPEYVIGRPTAVLKDDNGVIEKVVADTTSLEEYYQCDKCNNSFKVTLDFEFTSEKHMTISTSDVFVSKRK